MDIYLFILFKLIFIGIELLYNAVFFSAVCKVNQLVDVWNQNDTGVRGGGEWTSCLVGTELQFQMVKKFWKWIVVMVEQHCEGLNATEQLWMVLKWLTWSMVFVYFKCTNFKSGKKKKKTLTRSLPPEGTSNTLGTIIRRMDKQQGPTLQHRELYSISCDKP